MNFWSAGVIVREEDLRENGVDVGETSSRPSALAVITQRITSRSKDHSRAKIDTVYFFHDEGGQQTE